MGDPNPEYGWWERSQLTPDLRPVFATGMGAALELESQSAGVRIRFPWWDNAKDTAPFLAWLRTAADGDKFSDLDQGWAIDALCLGDHFHFLDRDWEGDEILANVAVPRDTFLKTLEAADSHR